MKFGKIIAVLFTTVLTVSATGTAYATECSGESDHAYGEQNSVVNIFFNTLTEEEWEQIKAEVLASWPGMTEERLNALRIEWEALKDVEPYFPDGYHIRTEGERTRLYNGNQPQRDCWWCYQLGNYSEWLHTDSEGYCYEDQWFYEDGKWYYFDGISMFAGDWKEIDGEWYYFFGNQKSKAYQNPNGKVSGEMLAGQWLGPDYTCQFGTWYYLDADGRMVTGWQQIDGKWYHFADNGEIDMGWLRDGEKWYYLSPNMNDCAMVTGWQKIDGKWYYFDRSGRMRQGWLRDGIAWYYFDENGAMLSNCSRTIDGVNYRFGDSGEWMK